MFSGSVQPSTLSLFSSTSSDALRLFSTHTDASLPVDSFIHLLHDATNLPPPASPATLIAPDGTKSSDDDTESPNYTLNQTVLHIQSPTLRTTYIHSPPRLGSVLPPGSYSESAGDLHLKYPWMHVQVRNMDRDWSLEIGLVDQVGRSGALRLSTFQKQPRLTTDNSTPLLHLPLTFPHPSSHPLTSWSTLSLSLPHYLQHFGSFPLGTGETADDRAKPRVHLPGGTYSHVSYVRVHASCRLRRIWFSDNGPNQELPWEFQLYGFERQE